MKRLYIREREEGVVVVGVFHLHRDPESWQRR
jgi:hypothetical protein